MTALSRVGPSGSADWKEVQSAETPPRELLVLPDETTAALAAGAGQRIFYMLSRFPELLCDSAGKPIISLTFLLERRPRPDEQTINHLIQQALLTFTVGWTLPDAVAGEGMPARDRYCPIYAHPVTFTLETKTGDILAGPVAAEGAAPRASLQAQFDRDHAVALFGALAGEPSMLLLRGRVVFRTGAACNTVTVSGDWAAIHDWMSAHVEEGATFTYSDLRTMLDGLMKEKLLTVSVKDAAGQPVESPVDPDQLMTPFVRAAYVILETLAPQSLYQLRARPDDGTLLSFEQEMLIAGERTVDIDASLDQVLGNRLQGQPTDAYVHLVYVDEKTGGLERGLRRLPRGAGVRDAPGTQRTQLMADGENFRSVESRMAPSRAGVTPALMVGRIGRPTAAAAIGPNLHHLAASDLFIDGRIHPIPQNHPVVDDPAAAVWKDRFLVSVFWYAPVFEVAAPSPGGDAATSPFLYSFSQQGHQVSGAPGIDATIRCTIRPGMSPATADAVKKLGNVSVRPVETAGLSVQFSLPFKDQTGATHAQLFRMDVQQAGGACTATLHLMDDWARACYGALAYAGYQSEPAKLLIDYTFQAYVPVPLQHLAVAFGGKAAATPVAFSVAQAARLREGAFVDARSVSYCHPAATIQFNREAAPRGGPQPAERAASVPVKIDTLGAARPVIGAYPAIAVSAVLADRLRRTTYALQTVGREQAAEILYPCNVNGAFYLQQTEQGSKAIGCQETFRLGQTDFRQYEKMTEADVQSGLYTVYRSLQQPGTFLVVPRTYRITRFAPQDGSRAYHPAICLYSTVDPDHPANNTAVLFATVQPDIPLFARHELAATLQAYAKEPVLEYLTEIEGDTTYQWTLQASGQLNVSIEATKLWDGFQVSMTCALDDVPLLQSMAEHTGIACAVETRLPDQTTVSSAISIDLQSVVGPWESGPIECAIQGETARLTNRIPAPAMDGQNGNAGIGGVNVGDLYTVGETGVSRVPVNATIPASGSVEVQVPAGTHDVIPIYSVVSGGATALAEIRNAIENITTNVVFVNLVNLANRGLKTLKVAARLNDLQEVYHAEVDDSTAVSEIPLVLPLTTYLAKRVLAYQVTRVDTAGAEQTGSWRTWDLAGRGNIVSLDWDMIQ